MKKILTLLLCCIVAAAMTQSSEQEIGRNGSQSIIEFIDSGMPLPVMEPVTIRNPTRAPMGMVYYTDRGVFDASFPGLPVEGYENSSIPSGVGNMIISPLDETTNNTYFVPGDILPGIQFSSEYGWQLTIFGENVYGFVSKALTSAWSNKYFKISFNPPVNAIGMDILHLYYLEQCQVDIFDANGNPLGSTYSDGSPTGIFWGVSSDEPIGEIVINSPAFGWSGADNIAFGAPLPPSVPLSDWAIYFAILLIAVAIFFRFKTRIA